MPFQVILARYFKHGTFLRAAGVLAGGTIAAQSILLASTPILSRLYTPENFGHLAIFLALSAILATAITLRYDTAIIPAKSEDDALATLLLSLILSVIIGGLAGLSISVIPDLLYVRLGLQSLGPWLPFTALSAIGAAILASSISWLNRQSKYSEIARIRVIQSVIVVLTSIGLGFIGFRDGLLFAQLFSLFAIVFVLPAVLKAARPHWNASALSQAIKKHHEAPKYLLPASVLDAFTTHLPIFLIAAWFSAEAAGHFGIAWRLLALPIALVGSAIGQVFFQRFAEAWPDPVLARRLLYRTWGLLLAIGLTPTLLLLVLGEDIFVVFLGVGWNGAGQIASVLAPMFLVMLVSSATSSMYLVLGLQRLSLYFAIAFLVYRPICIYLGLFLDELLYGLIAWVVIEIIAIIVYNKLALVRMKAAHEIH